MIVRPDQALSLDHAVSCRPDGGVFRLQVHCANPFVTLFPHQTVSMKLGDGGQCCHQLDHHSGRTLVVVDLKHTDLLSGIFRVPLGSPELVLVSINTSTMQDQKHAFLPIFYHFSTKNKKKISGSYSDWELKKLAVL